MGAILMVLCALLALTIEGTIEGPPPQSLTEKMRDQEPALGIPIGDYPPPHDLSIAHAAY